MFLWIRGREKEKWHNQSRLAGETQASEGKCKNENCRHNEPAQVAVIFVVNDIVAKQYQYEEEQTTGDKGQLQDYRKGITYFIV